MKKILEIALFVLGLTLFLWVIQSVDPARLGTLLQSFKGISWFVFLLYPFMCLWDVLGWKLVFAQNWNRMLRLGTLFWIRLAGEAINNITPVIDIGGEPLKVVLASQAFGIPRPVILASCVLSRTALLAAETLFILIGLLLSSVLLPLSIEWRWSLWISAMILTVVILLFVVAQTRGLFTHFLRWIERLPVHRFLFDELKIPFRQVDKHIAQFYDTEKKKFGFAICLHTIGWIAGGLETMILCRIVGIEVTFIQGVMLESLLQLVRTASFFIPANLGTQEAGLAFFLHFYGAEPAIGVAVSILKRLRQIVWTAIGFIVWMAFRLFPAPGLIEVESGPDVD